MTLTKQQHDILLKGINSDRIAQRKGGGGKALSYLEAWDVKAHMNRVFGFLNWSADVTSAELAYEDNADGRWNVAYKVLLTLKVNGATYTEAAVGSAVLPSRGEAHDMAIKTAESDAFKRAAINLGDQFGLSLYNNGSTQPVVKQTLVAPEGDE
jgi:DNA recombination protein Rad52